MKILVAEDEALIRLDLVEMLREAGYEVIAEAGNGQEAIDLVKTEPPDIMLLDVIMPGIDGFQVLEKVRAFSQMPVIVFSARSENSQNALSLGANAFLPKPFDIEEMVKRIESLLEHRA